MSYRRVNPLLIGTIWLCVLGCSSENAEELYRTNDTAAMLLYDTDLKSVVDNKCISCHTFHLEGGNRYDNYEKTKSSISQMLERINVSDNTKMPPADAPQLTPEEKELFQRFYDTLFVDTSVKRVTVAWTAYKYPDFETRVGVKGTFDALTYQLNENPDSAIDILKDATISIETASVKVGSDTEKTNNVGIFFSFFTPQIKGKVDSYTNEKALVTFTMNGLEQQGELAVSVETGKIILTGSIPDLSFFNWQKGYDKFNEVCGEYHEQKVWADIDVRAEILLAKPTG